MQVHNPDGSLKDISQAKIENLTADLAARAKTADLHAVATSGSYNDLTNKPTIPDASTLVANTDLDTKTAALVNSGSATDAALRAAFAADGLNVTNLAGLVRWSEARGSSLVSPVSIVALGDSITWGNYADDNGGTNVALLRERGWPSQLRQLLNAALPVIDVTEGNYYGLGTAWDAGTPTIAGAVNNSSSVGPFGHVGGGGGYSISNGGTYTLPPASNSLGRFTEVDVYYYGTDSGAVGSCVPQVTIDGVVKNNPSGLVTSNFNKVTITGLTDSTHDLKLGISGADAVRAAYISGISVRRDTRGFMVHRIAQSGAASTWIDGQPALSGQQSTRNIDSAILRGFAPLVIIAIGVNDQGAQTPIATYKTKLQAVIDAQVASGGCVLLLGENPDPTPVARLTEDDYRAAMKDLALANQHVAYTDIRPLFGDPSTMFTRFLIPQADTVHPSSRGHGIYAHALARLLTMPAYV